MKKGMIFSITLLAGFTVFSQDYQCIRDNATYFYSDGTNIKAVKIDSVVNTEEGLRYYNYPGIGYNDNTWCWIIGPSWIGRSVLVKPDGDNVFYNKSDQPVTIKSSGGIGEEWTCYQFTNGNYIKATIAEIQEMGFLGLTDSVKTITFQAYNSSGNPITHSVNDKYLELTRNYGFLRTVNFKLFPDLTENILWMYNEGCTQFELKGISNPQVGMQNLTLSSIWDYHVGDEIDRYYLMTAPGDIYQEIKSKHHILSKEVSNDTMHYTVNKCSIAYLSAPGGGYTYYHDTVSEVHVIDTFYNFVNFLPDRFIITYDQGDYREFLALTCRYYSTSSKVMKTLWYGFFSEYPFDCLTCIIEKNSKDIGWDQDYFIENLGDYYYELWPYSNSFSFYPVYYKSGNEEWGAPYSFNCEDFVTSEDEITISQKEVLISPNPTGDWARLSIDNPENKQYHFQLFNLMGVQVKEYHFQTNDLMIQRENLGNGIYFYLLSNGQKVIHSGKLIIQ